ncbi:MAG: hypothetical protein IJ214_12375 [Clostridia bacterium]|nr:hypothetical protein [Clostridia bacterium]
MRDYGIDLAERIDSMSWRQFAALARNLSPHGAAAVRAAELRAGEYATNDRARAAEFFAGMRAAGR